jgi:SAM-dependent methyltransferase
MEPFKEGQVKVWTAGDYGKVAERIAEAGELVIAAAGVGEGTRLLDVACGTGNATIPAARAGAQATGLDLTPKLLDEARARAEAEGVQIDFVEGDAEALPFDDASFDVVVSTFGHMFAPRHQQAADELVRVSRDGGTIALCTWTPEGTVGGLFRAVGSFMPPPPDFASSPVLWGSEDHVRELLGGAGDLSFERGEIVIEAESVDTWWESFSNGFGPIVTARGLLDEQTFGELRLQVKKVWEDGNTADDGSLRFSQEYLLTVLRR